MSLIRWSPFAELDTLQRRINTLFDDFPFASDEMTYHRSEELTKDGYTLVVNLPEGLDTEKAQATLENGTFTLKVPKLVEATPAPKQIPIDKPPEK